MIKWQDESQGGAGTEMHAQVVIGEHMSGELPDGRRRKGHGIS